MAKPNYYNESGKQLLRLVRLIKAKPGRRLTNDDIEQAVRTIDELQREATLLRRWLAEHYEQ